MDKAELIKKVEDAIELKRGQVHRLEQEIEETEQIIKMMRSDLFKLKTGKAYTDTFMFDGKEYEIVSEWYVKKVNGKNELRAHNLEDYLTGKAGTPFHVTKRMTSAQKAQLRASMRR